MIKNIQKFFEEIPDKFDTNKEGVDFDVQKEYLRFSSSNKDIKLLKGNIPKLARKLFDKKTSDLEKKKVSVGLAHCGTVKVYEVIKKFLKTSSKKMKPWAKLALYECEMFLRQDLTEKNQGMILTGLGGKRNLLRYYFVISLIIEENFNSKEKEIIKTSFNFIAEKLKSEIESTKFNKNYALIKSLIPMDVAIGDLIEKGIGECNQYLKILKTHYYVTNLKKPSIKDIKEYLKGYKTQTRS